jgi:ribonuclease BN (tRNA processing enzyme)
MKITLLPSSVTGQKRDQYLTTFVLNDAIAIDAGSLGFAGSPPQQAKIRHVVITHTHSDHIASLPAFVENAYEARPAGVTVYGSRAVLDCLRNDVFNDRVSPDFIRLAPSTAPFLTLEPLESHHIREIEGLLFTPVELDHIVPTFGLIVEEPGTTVVFASDTGPTDAIWEAANAASDLKAVFLDVAFPNAMLGLARTSKHMTPELFAREVAKIRPGIRILAVHLKARFFDTIVAELQALRLPNVEVCHAGQEYVI